MRRWLSVVVLSLSLGACASSNSSSSTSAPDFTLKDLNGNTVRLSALRGHPVLIDFWATWCGPCRISIPYVQEFYAKHKDAGLMVLGVNIDDDASMVPEFVRHFGMTYPVLLGGQSTVAGDYNVNGIPHFVLVDPQGNIAKNFEGFNPVMIEVWDEAVRAMSTPK